MLANAAGTENGIYIIIAIIGGIFAVAAVLGAAFAIFRQKLSESTVDLLKENNSALEQKNQINERTIADQQKQIELLQARVQRVEEENKVLKDRVDAKQELEAIANRQRQMLQILEGGAGGTTGTGRSGNRTG